MLFRGLVIEDFGVSDPHSYPLPRSLDRRVLLAAALAPPLSTHAQTIPTPPLGPGSSHGPEVKQGRETQLDPSPISAKAALAEMKTRQSRMTIVGPVSCRILERTVRPGDVACFA